MLADKPTFLEVYPKIAKLMTGVDLLVAHNLNYDASMLANELLRIDKLINFPWPRHHVCTVEASLHIKGHRMKLCDLVEIATGKPLLNAHRAKDDVRGLYHGFRWLVKKEYINLKNYEK
jgi:DNA polymerase III epsilon subunit-like protein